MDKETQELLAFMRQIENAKQMKAALLEAQKHDPDGTPSTGMYQAGGIFSYPFARPEVFSALQQPNSFIDTVPIEFSDVENEIVTIITGMTEGSGANAADTCGNPPTPGNLKVCRINLQFGKFFMKSKTFDVTEIGTVEHFNANPVQIQNWASSGGALVPEVLRMNGVNWKSDNARRLFELSTAYRRALARIEIDGAITNTGGSAERGWMREFSGLSRLIVDGITDVSGASCLAVDSLVENWGDTVGATVNGFTLPQLINDMYASRKDLANDVGMEGTMFDLIMPKRLFRALAYRFACNFVFTRCDTPGAGSPITRTDEQITNRFNEYFRGQYLPLDGDDVRVLFTSGAEEVDELGTITGGIFIVPRSWNGRNLLVLQPANLNNAAVQEFNEMGNTTGRYYSNNGMYAFATRSDGFCDELLMVTKMRLKLWTPFLAARIDDITYPNTIGFRNWNPAGSSFYNGGVTTYTNPDFPPTPL